MWVYTVFCSKWQIKLKYIIYFLVWGMDRRTGGFISVVKFLGASGRCVPPRHAQRPTSTHRNYQCCHSIISKRNGKRLGFHLFLGTWFNYSKRGKNAACPWSPCSEMCSSETVLCEEIGAKEMWTVRWAWRTEIWAIWVPPRRHFLLMVSCEEPFKGEKEWDYFISNASRVPK